MHNKLNYDAISIITSTGGREYSFSLCEKYISRQTYKNIQWIVVDDGLVPTKMNFNQEVIRPDIKWREGLNTYGRNLSLGLSKVRHDILFFIEDDDWYSEYYIETMIKNLKQNENIDIIGERDHKFYDIKTGQFFEKSWTPLYLTTKGFNFACLYKTCITKNMYIYFASLLKRYNKIEYKPKTAHIDYMLWSAYQSVTPYALADTNFLFNAHTIENQNLAIGIKNVPGRAGLSLDHMEKPKRTKETRPAGYGFNILKDIIKEDYLYYINL